MADRLLLTCEHGGNRVPREYAPLLRGSEGLLRSHRGYDAGALAAARALARATGAPLIAATTTRLLVDLNRSPQNRAVFSSLTRSLPPEERRRLLARHHAPHWARVRDALARERARGGRVLHVAVHSFAPALGGVRRDFEIALLYDPKRRAEAAVAALWIEGLRRAAPRLRLRRNAPYRGDSDGLTTALRREFPARGYLGLELELNQSVAMDPARRRALLRALVATIPPLDPGSGRDLPGPGAA